MDRNAPLVALAGLMLAASAALAQGSAGQGAGQGYSGTAPQGGRAPSGSTAFNDANTPGWSTMSAAERSAHQQRMQSFRTYGECSAYMAERRRARPGPGSTAGAGPTGGPRHDATAQPNDACAHLPRS